MREGELRWFPRDFTKWKYDTMTVWSAMEMGLSRRMMDKLHELSLEGWAGYLEEWLPSVAYEVIEKPHLNSRLVVASSML